MKCFSPIYVENKRAGPQYVPVPCGKCPACVQNKASQWYVRLKLQLRDSDNAVFVTLSYSTDHLPAPRIDDDGFVNFDVSRDDIRHYHARLRKMLGPTKSKKLKYFLVSEYGPNPGNGWLYRPHYHVIYFNLAKEDYPLVEHAWHNGNVEFGEITEGRLRYVSGYVVEKNFTPPGRLLPFSCISNGIGLSYVNSQTRAFHRSRNCSGEMDRFFIQLGGTRYPLPRYLRDRLYTPGEVAKFSATCSDLAEKAYQEDLAKAGSEEALQSRYTEIRQQCMRRLREKHKKKKDV